MLNAARLYTRYIGISFRGQMQYRASFVMQSIGQFLVTGVEFLGILVLFDRFGSLAGWALEEVALFYGIVNVSFALADATCRGFDTFGDMVKAGDFDRLLLRPRSTTLQLAGKELVVRRIGRLLQGAAVLIWAASELEIVWTPLKIGLAVSTVFGGACFFYALMVLQAILAFWTTETLELMNTLTYGGVESAQYPISIYRSWFRKFFTYGVPLAFANYFPGLAIMDRQDPLGMPSFLGWIAPLVGVLFLIGALQAWKVGVRHYRSTGS